MTQFFNPLAGSEYEQAWGPWSGTHAAGQNWQSGSAWDLIHSSDPIVVHAPIAGRVVSVGEGSPGRFEGFKVGIQGDDASVFLTHMRSVRVTKGENVAAGAPLGVGGKANGVHHLHIALGGPDYFDRDDDNGIDPAPYLRASADHLGRGPHGFPLYRGRAAATTERVAMERIPLPYGNTLRLIVNGERMAGWDQCRERMIAIASQGLRPTDTAAIAWRKRIWRGPSDVQNVVKNLVKRFLT